MAKNVQIRNVPDDTVAAIKRRAAAAGMSMSEYLRREIVRLADRPTIAEVLARTPLASGGGLTIDEVLEGIHEDRRWQ
jgi:plasmid stability protein